MKNIDTLSRYGHGFQTKTIACLLTDKAFLDQIMDILTEDFYDSEANKWLVEKTKEYYFKYKQEPTLDFFKAELTKDEHETLKVSVVEQLKKVWHSRSDKDLDYVKDEFLEFAKNQKVKSAILNSVNLLNDGNYDRIKLLLDDALNAGLSKDLGHDYIEDYEQRLTESARFTVKTGWPIIDALLDGGLGPGELGVCVASSGAGKSWLLSALGVAAMRNGLTVAHYTLELNETQTGLRYDSILSGHAPNEVRHFKDQVKEKLDELPGSLYIKYWPTKCASTQSIAAHFDRQTTLKGRPDLVLVDYADLLSSLTGTASDNTYLNMGNIYTQLRKLAGELDVPVWTVSQAVRSSIKEDVIEADMIADSYKKIMISDFVMSLSRKKTDKLNNTGRFHVIKNRFGDDGMTFPAFMDTSKGMIEILDPDSDRAHQARMLMNEDEEEAFRNKLTKQYQQMKNKEKSVPSESTSSFLGSKKSKGSKINL